jgi:hypothetical protein
MRNRQSTQRAWNISEISRKLDIPKSTTHVLVSTLDQLGYIEQSQSFRRFQLITKMFDITLRHVLPTHAGAQYPQHPMHKSPVVFRRTANCANPPRKQCLNPTPLHLRQLISPYTHLSTATNLQQIEK